MKLRGVVLALALGLAPSPGAPAGAEPRWAPVDSLAPAGDGSAALGNPRVFVDAAGRPCIVAVEFADSSFRRTLGWRAWSWRDGRFAAGPRLAAGGALLAPDPVAAPDPAVRLLWLAHDADANGRGRVLASAFDGARFAATDTILASWPQASELAGATGSRREWVARSEQRFPRETTYGVRVLTRPRGGSAPWHELPALGADEFTCGAAPLADDSVLVVHAGASGLSFAVGGATGWGRRGTLDPRPWRAMHPRLRADGDGGAWLLWTDKERAHVARWARGSWVDRDSLEADHPPGETFWAAWCDLDRGPGGGRPVLAWGERGHGATTRDVLCVAWPTATGWTRGREVPGTDGAILPTIVRDGAGTTWIAWALPARAGVRFTRTLPE